MTEDKQQPAMPDADQTATAAGSDGDGRVSEQPGSGADAVAGEELAALRKALDEAREQVLRTQAEMQNLRRRVERDVENAHKFALDKFVDDLLPVVDNLERATAAVDPAQRQASALVERVMEGVELTLRGFLDALGRHNVQPVNPAGEVFDPAFHQAVATVPDAQLAANRVVEVLQRGYTLNGRLVRPAMVVVSTGNENDRKG